MTSTLRIQLLGDFLLVVDEKPVMTINSPRLQSLLAYLVLHRSAPQDRSHLAFLLWPDSTEERAHASLRKLLYQLRQALPEIDNFLHADKQSLYWQPGQDTVWSLDVADFEQAQARQTQNRAEQLQALKQALDLYRGDLLPGCYEEWMVPERDRLRHLFFQMAEHFIALLEEEREYTAAIEVARRLQRLDPLHEATYRQLMRLYALSGDRSSALRIYHACVTLLERELGIAPGQATQVAYEALMQTEISIEPVIISLATRGTAPPLLGRKAEWRQLQEEWRKAISGQPRLVMLTGEAGIGKTRLAEEMEVWVSRQGLATASARCYTTLGQLAYTPVTTWLRSDALQAGVETLDTSRLTEIARIIPEVLSKRPDLPQPEAMTEGWQRQRFFDTLTRSVLNARQPLLLLLDDLQWCDNESLEWLQYLFRFAGEARLLLLGTVRTEETNSAPRLVEFLNSLQRDGLVTEIALEPLTMSETTSLAEHILGHPCASALSNALYQETEGNPLFAVEIIRAGRLEERADNASIMKNALPLLAQTSSTLPPTIQRILAARLAQLSPLAQTLAHVAAVSGREFSFPVLAQASGESEDNLVRGLDELWQRRIVREHSTGLVETYDFSHDKLREFVYTSLGQARRRLLHRRVGEALAEVYAENLGAVSGQIAVHYENANLPAQAILFYQRAGEAALHLYANSEALAALKRATVLIEAEQPGKTWQQEHWLNILQIYQSLGNVCVITGQHEEARQTYQRGLKRVPAGKFIWQARLLRKMAITWNQASDNPLDTFHINARQIFQEAGQTLEKSEEKSSQEWLREWIDLQMDQLLPLRGSADEMTATIEKVQAIVEQHGTAEQRGQLFQALGARDMKRNRYVVSPEALLYSRNALAEIQKTGNKSLQGFSHFMLGNRLMWAGNLDEAEQEMRAALSLAQEIGNTTLLMRCLTFLPSILRRSGQVEQVREVLVQADTSGAMRNNALLAGHQAWLAWRTGNLDEAETYGQASIEAKPGQRSEGAPFQWVGLWPLIGVALAREQLEVAINHTRKLLSPSQQPPPPAIQTLLEAVLQSWDAGQQPEALAILQQTVPLAREMGYL